MPRVTRETAEAHRRELIDAAGRLFREKGLDGVGVAEIGRAAGLTHGAIYSGFESKAELAAAALKAGRDVSRARIEKALGPEPTLGAILHLYISKRQRDDTVNCCPMLASASEAARQDDNYRRAFSESFLQLASQVQSAMERDGAHEARAKALTITASMIGVVAIARALDDKASNDLLSAARENLALLEDS